MGQSGGSGADRVAGEVAAVQPWLTLVGQVDHLFLSVPIDGVIIQYFIIVLFSW
jgi:hypothetical protein